MAEWSPGGDGEKPHVGAAARAAIRGRVTAALAGVPAAEVPARLCAELLALLPVQGLALSFVRDGTYAAMLCGTDTVARRLAEIQFTLGDGPGVLAAKAFAPVLAPDLASAADSRRWPVFAPQALREGARAVYSMPLGTSTVVIGALDLYRTAPAPGFDPLTLFDDLVTHCIDLLDADASGAMMADARGGLRIMAASGEEAVLLELLQLQSGDGPCVDTYRTGRPLAVSDLAAERHRWPELVRAALAVGYHSSHTVPLRLHEQIIGALTLFRRPAGHLPPGDAELAQALADSAALSLLHWSADPAPDGELLTKTQAAITYKNTLEIAKGMIALHAGTGVEEASRLLRDYAVRNRLSLAHIVQALVERSLDPAEVTAPSSL